MIGHDVGRRDDGLEGRERVLLVGIRRRERVGDGAGESE